ncbi:MAG TPA: exosortase N [Chryseosolibacter sp.]
MIPAAIETRTGRITVLALLLVIGFSGGVFVFSLPYFSNTNVWIGFCLFPVSVLIVGPRRNNMVYVVLLIFFAAMALVYHTRIFYFFSLAFYFLWLFELLAGRLNTLILFLIVFMSPFFVQVVTILGFPLRLLLSAYAAAFLNLLKVNVQAEGNVMILGDSIFSVDEACMGLNMVVMSMLMGVFVLAFRYRISGTTLGLFASVIFFTATFVLNVITNVIRIMVLVYFRIPPQNPMHDFLGVVCLVFYTVIPLYFLGGWLVRKYGKPRKDSPEGWFVSRWSFVLVAILPLLVLWTGTRIETRLNSAGVGHANVQFGNLRPEQLEDGITKLSTETLLIYVKTIPEFFTGEHTPLMCWKGSGYEFSGVATATVAGVAIYKGRLVRDGKSLHTAWWYSNGETRTISQVEWRLRMLKGEARFCLINVTADNEQMLMESIKSMFTTTPLIIKS